MMMNEQEMRELADKASALFMAQVRRERGKPVNTPVEDQLVKFEQELPQQVYTQLTHLILGGDPWVELKRTQQENAGPVWQTIRLVGIDPVHIGSHLEYRATDDGRVEQIVRHAAPHEDRRVVTRWPVPTQTADESTDTE